MNLPIDIILLHPDAQVPQYATDGAGCFDLVAINVPEQDTVKGKKGAWVNGAMTFETGIAMQIPEGWCLEIYSRSGHGFNHDVRLANCVGIIDSDYRGEIKVKLSTDDLPFFVASGDRIAQAKPVLAPRVKFNITHALTETERGAGGFGHTGGVSQ